MRSLTADGKPDGHRCGDIDSSNQCDAGCGELREPDGEDIGEPNRDGLEHWDGGTIDFAGECERNRLQHDGTECAGDRSGGRKHKLYGFVSTGGDRSGCRQRNDHEQRESLAADGKPDGHRCGGIDSSDQCDAGCGELREPDGEDIGEPNGDGFEHWNGGAIDFAGECERNRLQHDGAECAGDGSGGRKHKLYSYHFSLRRRERLQGA